MATRAGGTIIGRNEFGLFNIRSSDYIWRGVDFGADNKICEIGDVVKFEMTIEGGFRKFMLTENLTAKKREKSEKKKELIVIDHIHKDTGLVDIYLPSRDEHDGAFVSNWAWRNVKIEGLDLKSCDVKDQLLVEIETFQEKTKIKFVKNASKDKGEYTNTIVGKLCILPKKDGFLNNLSKCVKTIVGDKVFYDVDLGDYGGDISRIGDLVEVCVHYNDKGEPVKCVVVKNTSAIARQPIENNKQKQL